MGELEARFEAAKDYEPHSGEWLSTQWANMVPPDEIAAKQDTGVNLGKNSVRAISTCNRAAGPL